MIFVTGANGFIGRHVVRELLDAGLPFRVLLSRPNEEFESQFPGVETVCGDLLDEEVLTTGLAGAQVVLHLAAKNIDHDQSGFERINVEGTRRLCRCAAEVGVERVIYLSSVGVYGHGRHRGADESTPRHPDTPFSRSKAAAEDVIFEHHRKRNFQGLVLRHRFVYGEGDRAVMPRLIRAARKYKFWIGGGRAQMSWVWARDLARVFHRLAVGEPWPWEEAPVYHVTDGRPITYREVILEICRSFGFQPPKVSVPFLLLYAPVRLREILLGIDPEVSTSSITSIRLNFVAQDHSFSSRKLHNLLGDFRWAGFEEGFRQCLDDYQRELAAGE